MPEAVQQIRIFISSPGDVQEERDALEALIREDLQQTLGRQQNLYLEPLRWEKLVTPGMGDIQKKVFEEMGPYDIFVGIFWKRFGTPTSAHESGSEAEFRDAYKRWEEDNSRPILMYFCERPFSPTADDLEQLSKVFAFQKEIASKGLYATYKELDEFKDKLKQHLYSTITKLTGQEAPGDKSSKETKINQEVGTNQGTVIAEQTIHKHYYGSEKEKTSGKNTADVRQRYLDQLIRECQVLPLAQLGGKAGQARKVSLDDVYIGLSTTTPEKGEMGKRRDEEEEEVRYLSAKEAADGSEFMVLLGGPGSGKSTFVKQYIISQAEGPLPVFLELRKLAPRLSAEESSDAEDRRRTLSKQVIDFAVDKLTLLEATDMEPALRAAFRSGDVLLVLDGLDEVPYESRPLVHESVCALLDTYKLKRIIVTCRIRSYTGSAVLDGFQMHTLAPFDEQQIKEFIAGWYGAQVQLGGVTATDVPALTADLQEAALTEDLLELSSNPMLMTTMALVHQEETELPRERVVLYKKAVDILLRKWQQAKGVLPPALEKIFDNEKALRPIMERLAYEAHLKNAADKDADLPRGEALEILEDPEFLGDPGIAGQFLDYVDERSGLLVGQGGAPGRSATYGFPHRTFQEYLAGCYLVGRRSAVRDIRKLAKEGDFWSVAVQLGAQELLFNRLSQNQLLDNANQLLEEVKDEASAREALWSAHMANIAGQEVVERDEETGQRYLDRVGAALLKSLETELPPVERAEAGRLMAHLGDPDPSVLELDQMRFCYVPAGSFLMGDKVHDDEKPQHELNLEYGYWIGQYPVTQSQYRKFVEEGGYGESDWWTERGNQEKEERGWEDRESMGEKFDLPNHPVLGVSWYEAVAFTKWLTARWKKKGWLTGEGVVTLPNEPELEKAAKGGAEYPEKGMIHQIDQLKEGVLSLKSNENQGRQYPWGDEFEAHKLNSLEAGIGGTSRVGTFPGGISPYGAQDIVGNVWEWQRNKSYPPYPYPLDEKDWQDLEGDSSRVVRGGAWWSLNHDARCAYRLNSSPFNRSSGVGFRVVLLPFGSVG